eukprot:TRINITY_DN1653_c0_g1_i1.p1 TRINITY_DN1653_c0_g1~~TRINITY_DN1653_c0_g1_i1.p1  ORF type:complete len:206 (-),score=46.48 TRINITY_DN1653_c0_g1_i1:255-872(-)
MSVLNLKLQKRLAMSYFNVGRDKVWLDPAKKEEISKARTRNAIGELVKAGVIQRVRKDKSKTSERRLYEVPQRVYTALSMRMPNKIPRPVPTFCTPTRDEDLSPEELERKQKRKLARTKARLDRKAKRKARKAKRVQKKAKGSNKTVQGEKTAESVLDSLSAEAEVPSVAGLTPTSKPSSPASVSSNVASLLEKLQASQTIKGSQ